MGSRPKRPRGCPRTPCGPITAVSLGEGHAILAPSPQGAQSREGRGPGEGTGEGADHPTWPGTGSLGSHRAARAGPGLKAQLPDPPWRPLVWGCCRSVGQVPAPGSRDPREGEGEGEGHSGDPPPWRPRKVGGVSAHHRPPQYIEILSCVPQVTRDKTQRSPGATEE